MNHLEVPCTLGEFLECFGSFMNALGFQQNMACFECSRNASGIP